MEWEIITKEIRDDKGQVVIVETDEQIDIVGNIYQKSGAVIPKACQKCEKEFDAIIKHDPVKQDVPIYKCEDCDFKDVSPIKALDHKLEKDDHKIKKDKEERIVDITSQLVGRKANITILENDILIICDDCK